MALLFAALLLIGFGLWLAASVPGSRVSEWWARLFFFLAACLWALPALTGAG